MENELHQCSCKICPWKEGLQQQRPVQGTADVAIIGSPGQIPPPPDAPGGDQNNWQLQFCSLWGWAWVNKQQSQQQQQQQYPSQVAVSEQKEPIVYTQPKRRVIDDNEDEPRNRFTESKPPRRTNREEIQVRRHHKSGGTQRTSSSRPNQNKTNFIDSCCSCCNINDEEERSRNKEMKTLSKAPITTQPVISSPQPVISSQQPEKSSPQPQFKPSSYQTQTQLHQHSPPEIHPLSPCPYCDQSDHNLCCDCRETLPKPCYPCNEKEITTVPTQTELEMVEKETETSQLPKTCCQCKREIKCICKDKQIVNTCLVNYKPLGLDELYGVKEKDYYRKIYKPMEIMMRNNTKLGGLFMNQNKGSLGDSYKNEENWKKNFKHSCKLLLTICDSLLENRNQEPEIELNKERDQNLDTGSGVIKKTCKECQSHLSTKKKHKHKKSYLSPRQSEPDLGMLHEEKPPKNLAQTKQKDWKIDSVFEDISDDLLKTITFDNSFSAPTTNRENQEHKLSESSPSTEQDDL